MKYLYVPPQILKVIRDNGLDGRDYLDVNKLLSILSPEDLSFYLFVNLVPKVVLPEPVVSTFGNALIYGGVSKTEDLIARREQIDIPWERIEKEITAKQVSRTVNDYCVAETAPQLDIADMELSSEILWMQGGEAILFTHLPSSTSESSQAGRERVFYRRLLTQLMQFESFSEIATHPVFHSYLVASQSELAEAKGR